jgi:N-acetylated-alpha-linked acidic dipeptidase
LPGREQFKHAIFAPSIHNGHESSVFPFARDAIEKLDWARAKEELKKTAEYLDRAGDLLGEG